MYIFVPVGSTENVAQKIVPYNVKEFYESFFM